MTFYASHLSQDVNLSPTRGHEVTLALSAKAVVSLNYCDRPISYYTSNQHLVTLRDNLRSRSCRHETDSHELIRDNIERVLAH